MHCLNTIYTQLHPYNFDTFIYKLIKQHPYSKNETNQDSLKRGANGCKRKGADIGSTLLTNLN